MARTSRMNETAQGAVPKDANPDAADAAAHLAVSTQLRESVKVLARDGGIARRLSNGVRAGLLKFFADVRAGGRDCSPMPPPRAETTAAHKRNPPPVPADELAENIAFLDWLAAAHF